MASEMCICFFGVSAIAEFAFDIGAEGQNYKKSYNIK